MINYEIFPKNTLFQFVEWAENRLNIILLVPNMGAIGNCAEEFYFGLLKARREKKKLLLIWPLEFYGLLKINLPNIEVLNLESKYLLIKFDSFLSKALRLVFSFYLLFYSVISKLRKVIFGKHLSNAFIRPTLGSNYLWHPRNCNNFSWNIVERLNWTSNLSDPIPIRLALSKKRESEKLREEMGIPLDAWYVCLHVRESGFRDSERYSEGNAYSERNANISNYVDAINEVVRRGGWVVRMGDATMTPLAKMDKVVDYPFTRFKSKLMDIYLISECKFYIGMASGIYDVARLFQKPIVLTNMNNWIFPHPLLKNEIGIPRHFFSKSRNRFLSIKEWILEPWNAVSHSHPIGKEYLVFENSPDELRAVVSEYLDRIENKFSYLNNLRCAEYHVLRNKRGREIIGNQIYKKGDVQGYYQENFLDYDLLERYRLASRLDSAIGSIGIDFLEKNWDINSRN